MIDESSDALRPAREPVSARGRRTRAKLLECGREALAERGPSGTRVDDVVTRAGTSHGTFYLYFENVDDLLAAVVAECDAEWVDLLTRLDQVSSSPIDEVAAVLGRCSELRGRYGEIASPWVQPVGHEVSRVDSLASCLSLDDDRSMTVLAVIDRVLPELDRRTDDGPRRAARLIDQLRGTPYEPQNGARTSSP